MKKFTFGQPEKIVPSSFCPGFNYVETPTAYDGGKIVFERTARGTRLLFPYGGEPVYGLGLQLKGFNHSGRKMTLRVNADPVANTGDSHAPVPFFVSAAGYGVYIDTARYVELSFGARLRGSAAAEDSGEIATDTAALYAPRSGGESVIAVEIPSAPGVDVYIIEGKTITDIVAQYNMLAGGGCDVPEWGLGAMYRCHSRFDSDAVLGMGRYLRDKSLPVSVIGLEPGWQTHAYSCSFVWDKSRFPDPAATVGELRSMGYHVNLWQHAFTHPTSPIYEALKPYSGEFEVWGGVVPDFAIPAARRIFADYQRTALTALGVDGFKLDECDSSDFTGGWSFPNCARFPSGADGEQYHSLFGTLYMQAVEEALSCGCCGNKDAYTYGDVRNAGALAAPYPFALYSDLYSPKDFIQGVVNSGFSGLLWSPELRHADSKDDLIRRLQVAVFSAKTVINAWYCEEAPWLKFGCEDDVRALLELRRALVPELSRAFKRYRAEGVAPVRALVSDYTSDETARGINDEYMLGDSLLVAPIASGEKGRDVYLPDGEWADYFTGEKVASGKHPYEGGGIPVYRKVNA
jgi:alpha-D-xyloside xylohydrolase